ncbi:hypothetical protein [Actinomyces urogenitalis]|uniref:hypothetical protein n=1 Tax=Actinomyces urogenitalis TaxID=103621 RepID=UPI00242AED97|nr:hypothetical protein [Actinomyces urogenitalis]MCI7457858.1 hypothetical protein [Actinomyces urogenitalis]
MSNLDQEIADALAKVERLKEKKRAAEAKERARFAEAIMSVLDEIEDADQVSVRALVDRARAMLNEQDAKRRRAAVKAAAKRRAAAQPVNNVNGDEQRVERNDETDNQTEWGGYRVES